MPADAVMNRATRNQLLISYMEHMEKAEQAHGWKESVKHFQEAAQLADQISPSSRPERDVCEQTTHGKQTKPPQVQLTLVDS